MKKLKRAIKSNSKKIEIEKSEILVKTTIKFAALMRGTVEGTMHDMHNGLIKKKLL